MTNEVEILHNQIRLLNDCVENLKIEIQSTRDIAKRYKSLYEKLLIETYGIAPYQEKDAGIWLMTNE